MVELQQRCEALQSQLDSQASLEQECERLQQRQLADRDELEGKCDRLEKQVLEYTALESKCDMLQQQLAEQAGLQEKYEALQCQLAGHMELMQKCELLQQQLDEQRTMAAAVPISPSPMASPRVSPTPRAMGCDRCSSARQQCKLLEIKSDALRQKCEALEKQVAASEAALLQQLSEQSAFNRKFHNMRDGLMAELQAARDERDKARQHIKKLEQVGAWYVCACVCVCLHVFTTSMH